jgi:hypothetical protein
MSQWSKFIASQSIVCLIYRGKEKEIEKDLEIVIEIDAKIKKSL